MILVLCDICRAQCNDYETVRVVDGKPFQVGACCWDKPFRVPEGCAAPKAGRHTKRGAAQAAELGPEP